MGLTKLLYCFPTSGRKTRHSAVVKGLATQKFIAIIALRGVCDQLRNLFNYLLTL
jgi:hypothetical protein